MIAANKMTMDIATAASHTHRLESKMPSPKIGQDGKSLSDTKIPVKRSFDVAFLMLPDDKLKQKEKARSHRMAESPDITISANYPLSELSVRQDLMNRSNFMHQQNQMDLRTNKVFLQNDHMPVFKRSDRNDECERFLKYSASLNSAGSSEKSDDNVDIEVPRSAFSKVSQIISVDSPAPPVSPDQLSCSSASPPISCSPPATSNHHLYSNFRPDYAFINGSAFQAINQPQGYSPHNKMKNFMYRASQTPNESPQGYLQNFQNPSFPFSGNPHPFMAQQDQFIRSPAAAAILSTLLPTSLGALSLPAQNVCAKCNISFRMTSDLVYHMRSHHKNEYTTDPHRRKREEKLNCLVCGESFRERHHLARHMSAHQDKEGDLLDQELSEYHAKRQK